MFLNFVFSISGRFTTILSGLGVNLVILFDERVKYVKRLRTTAL